MIIYTDVITGDEMISDSYKLKEVDGIAYEADCRNIQIGGEEFDIGANPSAEEGGDQGVDDQKETVIDIVHAFKLTNTPMDKKGYVSALKNYMKAIETHLKNSGKSDAEIDDFKAKANTFVKKIVGNFKDYDFYVGESMNPDGMIVLLNYREDGITPYVTLWKHGLKEMKV